MTGWRRALFLLCRAGFGGFTVLSALYCLLAYNPFLYQQIIRFELLPWLTRFAALQPWLWWPAQALALVTFLPELRDRKRPSHRAALIYAGTALLGGIVLLVHPVLSHLENDRTSLVLGLVFLWPLFGVAVIDHLATRKLELGDGDQRFPRRIFWSAIGAGLFVFCLYTIVFVVRVGTVAAALDATAQLVVVLSSLSLHLVTFMAFFLALCLVRGLAGFWRSPVLAELRLSAGLAWIVGSFILHTRVLSAVSMTGAAALLISVFLAGAAVAALYGIALRICAYPGGAANGIELLIAPMALARSPLGAGFALAAVGAGAGLMVTLSATMDWNGLVAQLSALTVWTLAFTTLMSVRSRTVTLSRDQLDDPTLRLVMAALLVLGGYRWLAGRSEAYTDPVAEPTIDVKGLLTRFAGFEPSFRVLHDVLQARRGDDGALFEFLQAHTNIARDTRIDPTEVVLADLRATGGVGPRPNIFIVVVDSLRRDHLSPYNRDVQFTPGVERLAKRSHVFLNAFTHYGATGLSEPSIWVGGMLPHKQYVTPFRPFNALEKLLEAEHYDRYISVDTILSVVLEGAPGIIPLDVGISNKDYDLCRSLAELEGKLDARTDKSRPAFAYTQPQNIHVSRIEREGKSVPPDFKAPGFYLPYASRISHIDACFGKFVDFLDQRKMLDNSIVILTADHGDSLGEEGRWGHAYTIYPEIVRIPLIVHLPAALAAGLTTDHDRTVFSTDITPTLYSILGHPPVVDSDIYGRPLFWSEQAGPPARSRDWQMIVSSYGPVYGILEGGRRLYIADGVNYTEAYYDVAGGPGGSQLELSASISSENSKRIREAITEMNRVYRVPKLD